MEINKYIIQHQCTQKKAKCCWRRQHVSENRIAYSCSITGI